MTTIATPSGLTATVVNGNSVKLDWVDNSNNEQGFLIERKTTGDYSLLAVVAANVITYTDTTVVADTGYYYRLRGYLTESNAYIYVDKFGSGLSWLGPEGIHISADGTYLYLSDTGNNRIRKYLRDSPYTVQGGNWPIGGSGTGNGQFSAPKGVFDSSSYIFVCDSGNDRIQKFTMSGVYEAKIGSNGTGNDQFKSPCGIVASGGNLYITDRDNHRIHKRDTSNSLAYVAKFGSAGSGNGEFNEPYGIDVDTDFIYVCDKNNNRVQVFNIASPFGYVGQFGSLNSSGVAGSITDNGRLQLPTGIVVYGSYLYVTDRSNERIQIFQKAPPYTYVGKTGTAGSGNGQFVSVYGIDVNATKIYAVDADNARVTIFNNS